MDSIFGSGGFGTILSRYQDAGGQSQLVNSPLFNTAMNQPSALPSPPDRGMVDPRPFSGSQRPYGAGMNVLTGRPLGTPAVNLNTARQTKLARQAQFLKQQRAGVNFGEMREKIGRGGSQLNFGGDYTANLKNKYGQVWGNVGAETGEMPQGGIVKLPKALMDKRQEAIDKVAFAKADFPDYNL